MNANTQPDNNRLSNAIASLTEAWGKPRSVRGGGHTLSAVFAAIEGSIREIFERAGARIDFINMAPQRVGGPPDMGIVSGHIPGAAAYMARVFPSAEQGRCDVDIRLEMDAHDSEDVIPQAIFEAVSQVLGERLFEEGVYAQFMAHLLRGAGTHRARFYAELAQLVADHLHDPDAAP